jgi:ABC-type transport system involved in multi-copper enzyme maturation permease subunit
MTFLPIVERELRVRARQKSTYRFRVGGALVAIMIVALMLVLGTVAVSPDKAGAMIFHTLAWMAFVYCLLEGVRNTADCLSEEKRAGTLGLLFLTDLKGYDVVLGKLMATSLNSFYGLLAIFPALALPILLGGVTASEFWRLVLLLMNTLFFSLTTGLFVSASSRNERKAWVVTLSIILFFAVVPPMLRWLPFLGTALVGMVSPSTSFFSFYDAAYTVNPGRYWLTLSAVHVLSWLFLILASIVLPKAWQDRPMVSQRSRYRLPSFVQPGEHNQERGRRRLLDRNPMLLIARLPEGQRTYLWILIAVASLSGLVVCWTARAVPPLAAGLLVGLLALHFVLAIWVASQACYLLADARDSGTLELLVSTPLTTGEIIQGYFLALQRFFARPIIALLCIEGLFAIGQIYVMEQRKGPSLAVVLVWAGASVLFLIDLYAAGWFGMWMGLRSKKPMQALTRTVLYFFILPQLAVVCCSVLWPIMIIIKDLIFINYAQDQLRRQFRTIVTERFVSGIDVGTGPIESEKSQPRLPSVIDR